MTPRFDKLLTELAPMVRTMAGAGAKPAPTVPIVRGGLQRKMVGAGSKQKSSKPELGPNVVKTVDSLVGNHDREVAGEFGPVIQVLAKGSELPFLGSTVKTARNELKRFKDLKRKEIKKIGKPAVDELKGYNKDYEKYIAGM